jgi:hypothetical protein
MARQRAHFRAQTNALCKERSALEYGGTGILHHRTKVCGKPFSKGSSDPNARNGPYYEWGRMRLGKLV